MVSLSEAGMLPPPAVVILEHCGGSASSMFSVTCGTKQGCILAQSLLFSIFFAMLFYMYVAFHNCTVGIPLTFRTYCSTCANSSHRPKPHLPLYVNSSSSMTVPWQHMHYRKLRRYLTVSLQLVAVWVCVSA